MLAITDTWDYLLRQASASDVTFARLLGAAERGGGAALAQLLDELLVCGCHGASSLNPGG